MRNKLLRAAVLLYSLLCLLLIWAAPLNRYEWMMSDPAQAQEPPGFCALPLDDRAATALSPLPFVLPLALLGGLAFVCRRKSWSRPWMVAAPAIVMVFWFCRFVVFFPDCPDVSSSTECPACARMSPSAPTWKA